MGRYGTREEELDDLLRRGIFIDLFKVVRNGLRASRRGYGLKEMEPYLDRERKPVWWAFFDRIEMRPDELVEDSESIGGLVVAAGPEQVKRSQAWTLTYPAQEHKLGQGQETFDPQTRRRPGEIVELDRD